MATKAAAPDKAKSAEMKERDARLRKLGWGGTLTDRMQIQKWDAGVEVIGRLERVKKLPDRNGKIGGHIFYVDTANGRECYGAPTVLWEVMEGMPEGTELYILLSLIHI